MQYKYSSLYSAMNPEDMAVLGGWNITNKQW